MVILDLLIVVVQLVVIEDQLLGIHGDPRLVDCSSAAGCD